MSVKKLKLDCDPVKNFQEYIRIKTVHPNPDYESAIKFLKNYAEDLELPCTCIEVTPGNKIIIITWEGTDPSLPSVLLNSHTDVVPVFAEHWICDPFEAKKMENGDIYGRGTQDMKCVGIQYLEAIRRLLKDGKRFLRTVHLTFVPDEELGGAKGMGKFVHHDFFKSMNVGFCFDEGLANPKDEFTVFYGERAIWWINVKCTGNPGHASRFIENTAAEKLQKVINAFMSFREEEKKKLEGNGCLSLGEVSTVNLTLLNGGVQHNVVPTEITAGFDIRIPPTVDLEKFKEQIEDWIRESGDGIECEYLFRGTDQTLCPTDKDNPWWRAISEVFVKRNMEIKLEIFSGATDSRYLRTLGIPALGFSPINNTPILLHDHNEFLNEDVFLKGIPIYYDLISSLASVLAF